MQRNHKPFNELDLMMLREGWPASRHQLEDAVTAVHATKFTCAACKRIAATLHRTGAWFEARAARLSEI